MTFIVIKHSQAVVEADSRDEALELASSLPDSAWEDAWEIEVESEEET